MHLQSLNNKIKLKKKNIMKKSINQKIILVLCGILFFTAQNNAQAFQKLDKSPHDIVYYRETKISPPLVKVLYGRPSIKPEEKAFGDKVPFDKVWRTGANEATELKLYQDVMFGNTLVPAGTYSLVTVPGEKEWEVILNTNVDVLGAFHYNPNADVARIKVPVRRAEHLNIFSIAFKQKDDKLLMVLGWDSTRVNIPFRIKEARNYAKL